MLGGEETERSKGEGKEGTDKGRKNGGILERFGGMKGYRKNGGWVSSHSQEKEERGRKK